jgi:hypothetical protein
MVIDLPYSPVHSKQWLERFFKKDYYKKPYDRFMWWRSYTPKHKPLHPRQPFIDRIINGDFDIAPYRYEAEIVEHRLNEKWIELRDDPGRFLQEESVNMARRKRLLEDYDKEETRRLDELKRNFVLEFKMTKEQYDYEAENTTSTNLVNFYYKMKDKYGTRATKPNSMGGLRLAGDRNF